MDGIDTRRRRWRTLKERLGLQGMSCCGGATWGCGPATISVRDDEDEEEQQNQHHHHQQQSPQPQQIEASVITNMDPNPVCLGPDPDQDRDPAPLSSGMNLAAALAAERQFRATSHEPEGGVNVGSSPGTPLRVSLMRLLEETDGGDEAGAEQQEREVGNNSVCCVCMVRKKAAAFIPCGHTFCRVCSRELWLNRGSCPLCNRPILEILDIF